jgi:hypothetical protein
VGWEGLTILDYIPSFMVPQRQNEYANVALARAGLLGSSPTQPTRALRFEALEVFHQIRRRQSSFSVQAMAKVFCTLHNVSFYARFSFAHRNAC